MKASGGHITVTAMASRDGPEAYNQVLSERRGESVKEWLVSKYGLDPSQIEVDPLGESLSVGRPGVDNAADRVALVSFPSASANRGEQEKVQQGKVLSPRGLELEAKRVASPRAKTPTPKATAPGFVTFPLTGERLRVANGPDATRSDDYYDPNKSGNPLLDTGPSERGKKLAPDLTVDELAQSGTTKFDLARIDPRLVEVLQAIRDRTGQPLRVNSGYRSWKYNLAKRMEAAKALRARGKDPAKEKYYPAEKSQHMSGRAADVAVVGMSGVELAKVALDVGGCGIAIGLGKDFIHVDTRGFFVVWPYTGGVSERDLGEVSAYHDAKCSGRARRHH